MWGGRHRTHSPRHMPERVTRGSPSGCPQQEHGAVAPLPALSPPLRPPFLCTRPLTPPRPAAFLQPSQLLVSLPCQALCHGSWPVPPPSLRSPACRTLLRRLEPALTLAWTRLTPAQQPSTWSPSQLRTFLVAVPCPSAGPPAPCRHSVLAGLSTPHSRAAPPYEHPDSGSSSEGPPPPESRSQPGPASVPTARDACWTLSHLGALGPRGCPLPRGMAPTPTFSLGSVTKHPMLPCQLAWGILLGVASGCQGPSGVWLPGWAGPQQDPLPTQLPATPLTAAPAPSARPGRHTLIWLEAGTRLPAWP